jgi:DNA-binding transcriptional MerR regulator
MEVSNLSRAYSIKEAAELLGVNESSIRYWDKEYGSYLQIPRTENNERYFTDKEISKLENIKRLRDKGLSSKMVLSVLEKKESPEPSPKKGDLVPAEVSIAEIDYIREEFKDFLVDVIDDRHTRLEDKLEQVEAEILASLDEEMVRLHAKLNSDRDFRERDEYIRAKQENAQLRAEAACLREELGTVLKKDEGRKRRNLFAFLLRRRAEGREEFEAESGI